MSGPSKVDNLGLKWEDYCQDNREVTIVIPKMTRHQMSLRVFDNMLTKYQMIKFIDFYKVWFLPESVARVGVWRSPLPHASALIQRDFGCVLGVQQTKQLPHVAKVDLVWQLGV
ncbi:hypothetical protein TNCV_2003541 [Trichonephila clavipes]|nr:hypothetical protein TNCV_2003541 [Trichonephila clavipes]